MDEMDNRLIEIPEDLGTLEEYIQPKSVELNPETAYQVVGGLGLYASGKIIDEYREDLIPVNIGKSIESLQILGRAISPEMYDINPDFTSYCVDAVSQGFLSDYPVSEITIDVLGRIINSPEFNEYKGLRDRAFKHLINGLRRVDLPARMRIKRTMIASLKANSKDDYVNRIADVLLDSSD